MSWEASPREHAHPSSLQDRASATHNTSQPPPSSIDVEDHGGLSKEADSAHSSIPTKKKSPPIRCLTPEITMFEYHFKVSIPTKYESS